MRTNNHVQVHFSLLPMYLPLFGSGVSLVLLPCCLAYDLVRSMLIELPLGLAPERYKILISVTVTTANPNTPSYMHACMHAYLRYTPTPT